MEQTKEVVNCSFCGKNKQDTDLLIAGKTSYICDSCIEQAYNVLSIELKADNSQSINNLR